MGLIQRDEVHEALSCLQDNVALAQVRLAGRFAQSTSALGIDERANRLREILLEAIEVLRPPHHLPFRSLESRHYDVLSLRYVSSMSISEMCSELSLGRRQVHRDIEEAEAKLAQVLSAWPGLEAEEASNDESGSLRAELDALATRQEEQPLLESLRVALELVAPLAERRAVEVALRPGEHTAHVLADAAVLRQILVQMLSAAIQAADGQPVAVSTCEDGTHSGVVIDLATESDLPHARQLLDAQQIAARQGMVLEIGSRQLRLTARRSSALSVLVVEDNPSAVQLYRRYLPPPSWEVRSVNDPRLAYEAAKSNRPDIIILDIMMPRMDGWSVLATLAGHPNTAQIPVVICSVVYDPELGETLGARAYLKKPVTQAELLAALERSLLPRHRPASEPRPPR